MAKVAVIVPAAGAGKRFGGDVRKPFALLDNRPIFIRSIELFINRDDVCQTILTVAPDDYDVVREKYVANIMIMGLKLVKGGAERFESVKLALEQVDAAADLPAGEVTVRRLDAGAVAGDVMTHHLDPAGLVGLARELWGTAPPVVLVSVGVSSLELGDTLTADVEEAIPRAVDAVAAIIEEHGHA